MASIKTSLVKIGNSQGIRIPKAVIDQVSLRGDIEIEVGEDCLIVKAARTPRAGWENAFRKAAPRPDQDRDFDVTMADFDGDWRWK
ncbi:MAG: AbrB/MazE/SpoVT family DNA-binding domain-containing protein [Candidatus Riflebacteria bacterium]|nr:AbrB/MazE/SpoVT family DNA-binding domain-containing protein [Candidatus Riflebacteria bacterium]